MVILPALALLALVRDAKELDGTVLKLYSVISGPAGEKRDWAAFRALFVEDAKMRVIVTREGKSRLITITPEEYVAKSGPFLEKEGFFEKEVSRKTQMYGDMASVWTTYESRMKQTDKEPFERGVNALQLAKVDGVWKVLSIAWTGEKDAGSPPPSFREGSKRRGRKG